MNKKKEEKAFSSEEAFDEILNKLENIPWLKEYAEQLPADFIIKILQFLGFMERRRYLMQMFLCTKLI